MVYYAMHTNYDVMGMAELAAEDGTVERVDTPFHHTLLDLILKAVEVVQAMFTHHPQLKTIHQVVY